MRIIIALIGGVAVAIALFFFMQSTIQTEGQRAQIERGERINFVRVSRDDDIRVRERMPPEPPPEFVEPPPPTEQMTQRHQEVIQPRLQHDVPQLDFAAHGIAFGGQFQRGQYASAVDGDVIPVVRVEPQWPREALINGTEGWVHIAFTIRPDGSVANPRVIASEPGRLFDSSAVRAIQRWRFRPRVVDGRPVERQASQVIEFTLEGSDRSPYEEYLMRRDGRT